MARTIVEFTSDNGDDDEYCEYFDITNLTKEEFSLFSDAYEYNNNFCYYRGYRELKDIDFDDEFLSEVETLTSESVIDFVEGVVERDRKTLDDLSLRAKNIQEKKED